MTWLRDRVRISIGEYLLINVPLWSVPFYAVVFGVAKGIGSAIASDIFS